MQRAGYTLSTAMTHEPDDDHTGAAAVDGWLYYDGNWSIDLSDAYCWYFRGVGEALGLTLLK